jgi:hypothetical protein
LAAGESTEVIKSAKLRTDNLAIFDPIIDAIGKKPWRLIPLPRGQQTLQLIKELLNVLLSRALVFHFFAAELRRCEVKRNDVG